MSMEQAMNKKYKLDKTDTTIVEDKKLYRIVALVDFGEFVKAGDKGGYIESEKNLSHEGKSWVGNNAKVYGNARVYGNAEISGIAHVYGNAQVYDNAEVYGYARVYGNARVYDNAEVYGNVWVYGNANVCGNSQVHGDANVYGNAKVFDEASVSGTSCVAEDAEVYGGAWIHGNAYVSRNADISDVPDYFCVQSFGSASRTTTFFRTKDGWLVSCGCFKGTVEEFRKQVKKTHGDSLIAQEYLLIADLMDLRIKRQEAENEAE